MSPGYIRTQLTAGNTFSMPGLMEADEAARLLLARATDDGSAVTARLTGRPGGASSGTRTAPVISTVPFGERSRRPMLARRVTSAGSS